MSVCARVCSHEPPFASHTTMVVFCVWLPNTDSSFCRYVPLLPKSYIYTRMSVDFHNKLFLYDFFSTPFVQLICSHSPPTPSLPFECRILTRMWIYCTKSMTTSQTFNHGAIMNGFLIFFVDWGNCVTQFVRVLFAMVHS